MDLKEQYDKLLRYCYAKTKDRNLAEDIVQETFLKFWQSKSYENTGKEMAYLYTIARNLCVDAFRIRKVENIENYPSLPAEESAEPERRLEQLALEDALDKLPQELRDILVMRYVSELSASQIGKVMGMSRFSVHRRLREGLAIVKKQLEEGRADGK